MMSYEELLMTTPNKTLYKSVWLVSMASIKSNRWLLYQQIESHVSPEGGNRVGHK